MSGWADGVLVVVEHSSLGYDLHHEIMFSCHMMVLYSSLECLTKVISIILTINFYTRGIAVVACKSDWLMLMYRAIVAPYVGTGFHSPDGRPTSSWTAGNRMTRNIMQADA